VNVTHTDYVARVRELTDGKGVRFVFNGVGGDTLAADADVTAPFGEIQAYGYVAGKTPFDLFRIKHSIAIKTFSADDFFATPCSRRRPRRCTNGSAAVSCSRRAVILPLAQVAEANRMLERGEVLGKIALRPEGGRPAASALDAAISRCAAPFWKVDVLGQHDTGRAHPVPLGVLGHGGHDAALVVGGQSQQAAPERHDWPCRRCPGARSRGQRSGPYSPEWRCPAHRCRECRCSSARAAPCGRVRSRLSRLRRGRYEAIRHHLHVHLVVVAVVDPERCVRVPGEGEVPAAVVVDGQPRRGP